MQLASNLYGINNMIALTGASAVGIWNIGPLKPSVRLFWIYCLVSAIWVFMNPWQYGEPFQPSLDASSAEAAFQMLVIPFAALACAHQDHLTKTVWRVLAAICVIDSILLWCPWQYGLWNVKSMDTTAIAMMSVAVWDKLYQGRGWQDKIIAILAWFCVLTILFRGKSTGIFVLAAGLGVDILLRAGWRWALGVTAGVLGTGWLYLGSSLVDDSARFKAWSSFLDWWSYHVNVWFGSGLGTFQWMAPWINPGSKQIFYWAHNEYLQLLFEGGIIGCALFGWVMWDVLKAAWKQRKIEKWMLPACAATAVGCLTQFPMRFGITQFFVCFLVFKILEREDYHDECA